MLKILIVDDEKGTRDVIVNLINWSELGISWVGEAEDGVQALEIAAVEKPDIIITDIKMPKMNGIELVENLREVIPNCKIIFLTGYSDKEYFKAAIRYKAVSYVEKPVDLNEITCVLKIAATESLSEKEQRQKYLTDEISALSLDLINKTKWNNIHDRIAELNLLFNDTFFYTTAILHFHMEDAETQGYHDIIRSESLDKLKAHIACFEGRYILGFKGSDHLILHFSLEKQNFEEVKIALQSYLDEMRALYSFTIISAALGSTEKGLAEIPSSYNAAVLALQQRFFKGIKRVLSYHDITSSPFAFNDSWLQQIRDALIKGSLSDTVIIIKRLANEIRKYENTQPDYIRNVYVRIVILLSLHAKERNVQLLKDECSYIQDSITNSMTLDDIEGEIISLINSVFSYMEPNIGNDDIISKITKFIHEHYTDPELSVNAIADNIYLTTSYICVFFKKVTGKTINQYITEYRIEKAKGLLRHQMVKIQDAAENVGYADAKYFSRVFEKTTGLKPKKYMELHYEA